MKIEADAIKLQRKMKRFFFSTIMATNSFSAFGTANAEREVNDKQACQFLVERKRHYSPPDKMHFLRKNLN